MVSGAHSGELPHEMTVPLCEGWVLELLETRVLLPGVIAGAFEKVSEDGPEVLHQLGGTEV